MTDADYAIQEFASLIIIAVFGPFAITLAIVPFLVVFYWLREKYRRFHGRNRDPA